MSRVLPNNVQAFTVSHLSEADFKSGGCVTIRLIVISA